MYALILTFACAGCGPSGALTIGPLTQSQCAAVIADMRNVEATYRNAPAFMACLPEDLTRAAVNSDHCIPTQFTQLTPAVHQKVWWCNS